MGEKKKSIYIPALAGRLGLGTVELLALQVMGVVKAVLELQEVATMIRCSAVVVAACAEVLVVFVTE